jgi:hypothetical protein
VRFTRFETRPFPQRAFGRSGEKEILSLGRVRRKLLSPAKECVTELIGFEMAAPHIMEMVQPVCFYPMAVPIKLAAGRELRPSVPGANELNE